MNGVPIKHSTIIPLMMSYIEKLQKGQHCLHNFVFSDGRRLPELRIAYATLGTRDNPSVLLLHGTIGTGIEFLKDSFGSHLFGPGQPLDIEKYFIIMPDSIGLGLSAKPSDGLKMNFPHYDYDDMVRAQFALITECLHIDHLRLIIGNSMGGMHAWMWGYMYPNFVDALVPMAATPAPMSGRNWLMRRFLIDSIRRDPTWLNGDYISQPTGFAFAFTYFCIATNGGLRHIQSLAPTVEAADAYVDQQLSTPWVADANDHLYRWESSRRYDPSGHLHKITAAVLAIVSEDDERNPVELGILLKAARSVSRCDVFVIPATEETVGHSTAAHSRWWAAQLQAFLDTL